MKFVHTALLEIAYEDDGPRDGSPVMLLHGWPDAPRGWNGVLGWLLSPHITTSSMIRTVSTGW